MKEIYSRRSTREYQDKAVSREKLIKIVRAGMNAPSSHNQQGWKFLIIDDRDKLNQLANNHSYAKMLSKAPAAILVYGDMGSLKKDKDFWQQDCAAATQNILLEIEHEGLGGVWIGVYPKENYVNMIKDLFKGPDELIPFCLIAVGYKNQEKTVNSRFDQDKIGFNEWK